MSRVKCVLCEKMSDIPQPQEDWIVYDYDGNDITRRRVVCWNCRKRSQYALRNSSISDLVEEIGQLRTDESGRAALGISNGTCEVHIEMLKRMIGIIEELQHRRSLDKESGHERNR